MIIKKDTEGICVEADMGTESPKRILEKLFHYSMYLLKDVNDESIENLKIYFIFPSRDRLEHVFLKDLSNINDNFSTLQVKSSVYSFLEQESNSFKISKDKGARFLSISTRDFLRLFLNGKIRVFSGLVTNRIDEFDEIPFVGLTGQVKGWKIKKKVEKEVEI
jgi:hypothetical protein